MVNLTNDQIDNVMERPIKSSNLHGQKDDPVTLDNVTND